MKHIWGLLFRWKIIAILGLLYFYQAESLSLFRLFASEPEPSTQRRLLNGSRTPDSITAPKYVEPQNSKPQDESKSPARVLTHAEREKRISDIVNGVKKSKD